MSPMLMPALTADQAAELAGRISDGARGIVRGDPSSHILASRLVLMAAHTLLGMEAADEMEAVVGNGPATSDLVNRIAEAQGSTQHAKAAAVTLIDMTDGLFGAVWGVWRGDTEGVLVRLSDNDCRDAVAYAVRSLVFHMAYLVTGDASTAETAEAAIKGAETNWQTVSQALASLTAPERQLAAGG